ncbi:MAG TPA: hypothetical protein VM118_03465 [Acidobacteriota bacterium]|nr:hypothetical protein [Acidobacteriota bacterium]
MAVLEEWSELTGDDVMKYRLNLMLHMAAGRFSGALYDRSLIGNLLIDRECDGSPCGSSSTWGYSPVDESLAPFTRRMAREMLPRTPEGSIERLLCECFAGDCDSIFQSLKHPEYGETPLAQHYDQEIQRILAGRTDANLAFYSGIWIPRGDNDVLGSHPFLGVVFGGAKFGYLFNVLCEVRLLNADKSYVLGVGNRRDTTKSFTGHYLGIEAGRELVHSIRHEVFVTGGVGFDGFLYDNPVEGDAKRAVNAFNANVGLGYKFHPRRLSRSYVGVQVVYNFIDYQRAAGTGLAGDAVSLRILVGRSGDTGVNQRLRCLGY